MRFMQKIKSKFKANGDSQDVAVNYKDGMKKTRKSFSAKLNDLIARHRKVDEDFFEELGEVLIMADGGIKTVMELIGGLNMEVKRHNIKDTAKIKEVISNKLVDIYYGDDGETIETLNLKNDELSVIHVVGVNGVGKTTSIGKLAHQLRQEG